MFFFLPIFHLFLQSYKTDFYYKTDNSQSVLSMLLLRHTPTLMSFVDASLVVVLLTSRASLLIGRNASPAPRRSFFLHLLALTSGNPSKTQRNQTNSFSLGPQHDAATTVPSPQEWYWQETSGTSSITVSSDPRIRFFFSCT